MSQQQPPKQVNSTWGKLGLAAGAVACVLPIPMFGIKVPALPAFQQNSLLAVFIVAMLTCSLIGSRRPLLGVLVCPVLFFGVSCLACWWIVSGR